MSNPQIIFLAALLLHLVSCKKDSVKPIEETEYNESGLTCRIITPAGDIYEDFSKMDLPPFFNVGQFQLSDDRVVDALVLSKRVKKGKRINVDPVALFSLMRHNETLEYVVAIPHDNGTNNLIKEYDEFLTKNNELKQAVENWFKAQCGIGFCNDFTWQNSYKALLELE